MQFASLAYGGWTPWSCECYTVNNRALTEWTEVRSNVFYAISAIYQVLLTYLVLLFLSSLVLRCAARLIRRTPQYASVSAYMHDTPKQPSAQFVASELRILNLIKTKTLFLTVQWHLVYAKGH